MAKTYSVEAEQWILGTLLIHPDAMTECPLDASDFSQESNRVIFNAIGEVVSKGVGVDLITVATAIETKLGTVDMDYINTLAEQAGGSPANMPTYSRMLQQFSRLRKARDIAEEIRFRIERTADDECASVIDDAIQRLMDIDSRKTGYEHKLDDSLIRSLEKLDYLNKNRDKLPGVSSGMYALDQVHGGFRAKKLYVFGARPGGGKTALMMNFVSTMAKAKIPQGIFSAEMDHEELSSRLISIRGAINSYMMNTGRFDSESWTRLDVAVESLKRSNVYINDEPSIGILPLMRQARIWKKRHGIKAVFVDYMQLLRGSSNRQTTLEKVTEVTQSLKQLARELDLPVIALAQLRREADDLQGPAGMNYFADASAIEKDANFAATLWANDDAVKNDQLTIHICKNRDGPKGDVIVNYQRGIYRITSQGHSSYSD